MGPSAALATIRKFKNLNAHHHLVEIGSMVQAGWRRAAERTGLKIDVSGIAPLSRFIFQGNDYLSKKAFFIQFMLEREILASNLFYAMYAHTEEQVANYLTVVEEAFDQIAKIEKEGVDFNRVLVGEPSVAGFGRLI